MNRRGIIGGIIGGALGLFGLNKVAKAETKNEEIKGFIIYYLNVGSLPPHRAEMFCDRVKDQLRTNRKDQPNLKGWAINIVPVRPPQETRVEIHSVSGEIIDKIDPLIIKDVVIQEEFKDTPELRESTKQYIKAMLGAPAFNIEIDDAQIDFVSNLAIKQMRKAAEKANKTWHYCRTELCFQAGVLSYCTIMLGRIRNMYIDANNPEHGNLLIEEGNRLHENWLEKMCEQ